LSAGLLRSRFFQFPHVYLAALEFNFAVNEREKGVVSATTDIETGVELGSALADDDGAGGYNLAAVGFDAAVLGIAVSAVAGRTGTFFMGHKSPEKSKSLANRTTISGAGGFTGEEEDSGKGFERQIWGMT
jgi:hypothetical protein